MTYARRTDQNLELIVVAARKCGFLCYVRNDPLGDLDVQLGGIHEVWECKNAKGRFTDGQEAHRKKGWIIHTIRSVEDVLERRKRILKGWAQA